MTSQPFRVKYGIDANQQQIVEVGDPSPTPAGDLHAVNLRTLLQNGGGLKLAARVGNLPSPNDPNVANRPRDGQAYLVKMDLAGGQLDRIAVWDGNRPTTGGIDQLVVEVDPAEVANVQTEAGLGSAWPGEVFNVGNADAIYDLTPQADGTMRAVVTTAGTGYAIGDFEVAGPFGAINTVTVRVTRLTGAAATGGWRFANLEDWIKTAQADPDQPYDRLPGDIQTTTEVGHEEIKVYDGTSWVTIYSTDLVKSWIASLNLFQGTVQEVGGAVVGTLPMDQLPDITVPATGLIHNSQYWVWTGQAGYTIQGTDPNGVGADLANAVLQVGDWLQVSSRGGTYHWSHIGGDLLAKSRADALYSLRAWADGNYEQGSLVNADGSIWRANTAVQTGDPAPGAPGAPWSQIALTAGVRSVATDGDLPPVAAATDVYLVLNSAQAGARPALFSYDPGAAQWIELGGGANGGGTPLDLGQGDPIVNVGVPVGAMMMWWVDNPPPGWLICNGQTFVQTQYPELATVLGTNTVPDLRGSFIRGAGLNGNGVGDAARAPGSYQIDATKMPNNGFGTNTDPGHDHGGGSGGYNNCWKSGACTGNLYTIESTHRTGIAGQHSHTITGGDPETRPVNWAVHYIIKASDSIQRLRLNP